MDMSNKHRKGRRFKRWIGVLSAAAFLVLLAPMSSGGPETCMEGRDILQRIENDVKAVRGELQARKKAGGKMWHEWCECYVKVRHTANYHKNRMEYLHKNCVCWL